MGTIAITPDSRSILLADDMGYGPVYVRDFSTMTLLGTVNLESSHRANHIVAMPDNRHILVVDHDGYHLRDDTLCIFDLLDGSQVNMCGLNDAAGAVVTPDGKYIVVTGAFRTELALWDWRAGTAARIWFDQKSQQKVDMCVVQAVIPDGNKVVVSHFPAGGDTSVAYKGPTLLRVWDPYTGTGICTFSGYRRAEALPDGQRLLAIAEETSALTILNIRSGRKERVVDGQARVSHNTLMITLDGRYAIARLPALQDGQYESLGVWDLRKGKLDHVLPWQLHKWEYGIAMTSDGGYLVRYPGHERWQLQERRSITVQ